MSYDIDEAIDWRGAPVDCDACAHRDRLPEGKCAPLKACAHDRYARRIDRFFDWNPDLARDYLAHPYFEARACAAKAAEIFLIPALLDDPEEAVRWSAARWLPRRYLLDLRNDPHREVRIRIAGRLEGADLLPMISDDDYYVRQMVARRLPPDLVILLAKDPDAEVRRVVAQRVSSDNLARFLRDEDASVRLEAAQRLKAEDLGELIHDPDWRVRFEVAQRGEFDDVARLAVDGDPIVRETAMTRLAGAATNIIPAPRREDRA